MYADDATVYVRHPEENVAALIHKFIQFRGAGLSGVTSNWAKSVIFPITSVVSQFPVDYPLQWADASFRYLGIWMSRAMAWLKERIPRWNKLPLSMAGRIAIAKMRVLPKLLYLFINLSLPLTRTFFTRLRCLLICLVRADTQPRSSWEVLTLPFEQGGMCAPDMEL